MDRTLIVYDNQSWPEFTALALAFARGAEAHGVKVQYRNPSVYRRDCYTPATAVLVYGVKGPCEAIIGDQLDAGGCPIVLEMGFVGRGMGLDAYWSIGIGGLNAHADFKNVLMPGDRWADLNVPLQPWRRAGAGQIVVVAGQVPGDANVVGIDTRNWAQETIAKLRRHTDRPIVYRPHPKDYNLSPIDGVPLSRRPLQADLAEAWALVTWNSNSSVDAVLAGVPVFCMSKAMASDVGLCDLGQIETPATPDRQQWAHSLAYAQWRVDEIEKGLTWRHLMEGWPDPVAQPAREEMPEEPETVPTQDEPEERHPEPAPKRRGRKKNA